MWCHENVKLNNDYNKNNEMKLEIYYIQKAHTSKLGFRNKNDFKHRPSIVHDGGCTITHIE